MIEFIYKMFTLMTSINIFFLLLSGASLPPAFDGETTPYLRELAQNLIHLWRNKQNFHLSGFHGSAILFHSS